jgi:hypothetical protein
VRNFVAILVSEVTEDVAAEVVGAVGGVVVESVVVAVVVVVVELFEEAVSSAKLLAPKIEQFNNTAIKNDIIAVSIYIDLVVIIFIVFFVFCGGIFDFIDLGLPVYLASIHFKPFEI